MGKRATDPPAYIFIEPLGIRRTGDRPRSPVRPQPLRPFARSPVRPYIFGITSLY
ncbi:MAG: hypothetical protein FWG68_08530 [Defluviitaleaceae bacterium]|nr:hypothetical protein [Defluviitaleaceae bacterium]